MGAMKCLRTKQRKKEKAIRFIKLTDETGRACYIDAELIEAVAGINYKDKPCRSRINSISDNAYYVQESPEVIVEMLEQMVAADDVGF